MSRRERFLRLRDHLPVILPSLLLCDFTNLEREVARLEEAGVRALHLDVMDGCFVPNLPTWPSEISEVNPISCCG